MVEARLFLRITDIRSEMYEKAKFKAQSCTCLCTSPNSVQMRKSTRKKTWYSQNGEKVQGGFHQSLGLKNTILLMLTDTQWGLYEKALFKAPSRTRLCKLPNSDGAGNLHGRRPSKAKTVQGKGFQQTLGFKNTIWRGSGETQWTVKATIYFSGDWYWIRVQESFFKAQSCTHWCKSPNSNRGR